MAIPDFLKGEVVSFDTETAQLGDHIIEIGLSIFRNAELVYEWGTYVKPTVPIDLKATEVNHITERDVEDSPTFVDICPILMNYLRAADVFIAYNYDYDCGVLNNELTRLGIPYPKKPIVDPFILFKMYHKYNKGKTLIKAAEKYGVQYIGAHRAVNDATVTGRVLFKMAATKPDFPKDLITYMKKQRQLVEEQYNDLNSYFIKVGKGSIDPPNYSCYE